jgi:hypothetical protein
MKLFDADSIFELEALRQTLTDAREMYEGLLSGPNSQVRFDGHPTTLGKRLQVVKFLLTLVSWREHQLFEDGWDEITFWLDKEGMDWGGES